MNTVFHTTRLFLVLFSIVVLSSCGDIQRNFNGQASDGSLVAADIKMVGLGSLASGEYLERDIEELFSLRMKSSKGWSCEIDYEQNSSDVPDNALEIICSDGSTGLLVPQKNVGGKRGFTFGLSNGVTGVVTR